MEFRKRGIASTLLGFVMEEVKIAGCRYARLHASSQAKGIYEKMGFADAEGFMSKKIV